MKQTAPRIIAACLLLFACAPWPTARAQTRQPVARKFDEFTAGTGGANVRSWHGKDEAERKDLAERFRLYAEQLRKEGALPSVVGGLVSVPVVAVPTSVGYGASFGGAAALLGMLNSCASNVTVVNIDNGFGAGFVASLINRRWEAEEEGGQQKAEGRGQ